MNGNNSIMNGNNSIMNDNNSIVMLTFLTIVNQVKLYHWQTLSHPRHKATDELYSDLSDNVDKFIEVLTGRCVIDQGNNKYRILMPNKHIKLQNYTDDNGLQLIKNIKLYLESPELNNVIGNSTELGNIRDEMLASINKASYLFTLN
jgi:hypothetical protein